MTLTFTKVGNEWVAEFEAPSDFNLHIEREDSGIILINQRGVPYGEYAFSFMRGLKEGKKVFDQDFGALVYPKYIQVISSSKVLKGVVTFA